MFAQVRRLLSVAVGSAALFSAVEAHAQVRLFQACSQGALLNCAGIRLTSQLGVGPSNTNRFEIGIQNLGSQASPSLATSLYFASFVTGQPSAPNFIDALVTPTAQGGATITNNSDWSLFESGDAVFLSSLSNDGIGGCASAAATGGFGLMGQTCGASQFISFSFFTPRTFDVRAMTLAGLEFVALDASNTSDSCNDVNACTITEVAVVPEPSSLMLIVAGLAGIVLARRRRLSTREA